MINWPQVLGFWHFFLTTIVAITPPVVIVLLLFIAFRNLFKWWKL